MTVFFVIGSLLIVHRFQYSPAVGALALLTIVFYIPNDTRNAQPFSCKVMNLLL